MTKYCTDSYYGTVDNKRELEAIDDAATANWGSEWQMPSYEQCAELINSNNVTTTWTTLNGVKGRKIVSKKNGNSLFLPAAGYRSDTSLKGVGSGGRYWSRSLYTSNSSGGRGLYFYSSNIYTDYYDRYYGLSVRPVRVQENIKFPVESIELNNIEVQLLPNKSIQLSATVLPWYATNKDVQWESNNTDIVMIGQSGLVTAVSLGACTITCKATDGSGVKAECIVTVNPDNSGTLDGHEYVDLGLPSGTLWATCNVGAASSEEYGDYFAWGETQPKEDYSWGTYKYCMGTDDTLTKYCTRSNLGTVDNKTELEAIDDAATANWGSEWQMPSGAQLYELINSNYTTFTWTTQNGVYGRKIVSKQNGNSLFLPAAGSREDTAYNGLGSRGNYWSRSLNTSNSSSGRSLYFYSSDIYTNDYYRCYGRSVRPVRVQK